jgi:hypothetical protein
MVSNLRVVRFQNERQLCSLLGLGQNNGPLQRGRCGSNPALGHGWLEFECAEEGKEEGFDPANKKNPSVLAGKHTEKLQELDVLGEGKAEPDACGDRNMCECWGRNRKITYN